MHPLIQSLKNDVNSFISGQRTLMFNEGDFQLQLAGYLRASKNYDDVYVEYFVPNAEVASHGYKPKGDLYLDIVVCKDGKYAVVELKYPTKEPKIDIPITRFGDLRTNTDIKIFKTHSAHNNRSYDFWADVHRIEVVKAAYANVVGGLAVMLTNDEYYTRGPRPNAIFTDFSTADGRTGVHGKLVWSRDTSASEDRPAITLNGTYTVKWNPNPLKIAGEDFHYTIITI